MNKNTTPNMKNTAKNSLKLRGVIFKEVINHPMHATASQSLYLVAYLTKAHTGLNCEIVLLGYEQNTTLN